MDQEIVKVLTLNVDTIPIEHLPFLNHHTGLYERFDTYTLPRFSKKLITYIVLCMYKTFLPPPFIMS